VIMEPKLAVIEKFIEQNATNEMEAAAIREYAITQEIGLPTPYYDLPNLKQNRIVIELVNRTNQDQQIDLFQLPQGINPEQDLQYGELFETLYCEVSIPSTEFGAPTVWFIRWDEQDGTPRLEPTNPVTTPAQLITELISITGDNWDFRTVGSNVQFYKLPIDTWLYWNPPAIGATPPAGTQPASFYTRQSMVFLGTAINTYNFSCYEVIGGTGISVTEVIGNLTYAELTQELRNNIEPYFFDTMTIYSDNISQANTPITKLSRGQAGNTRKLINNPAIVYQNKFVVTEQINVFAKTLNELQYTVRANNTLKIIITYTAGRLNYIAQTINAYIEDGIPFTKSLKQLEIEVSKKEKEYLENVLRKVWERKKKELAKENIEIEIENIFEPQEVIDAKKQIVFGEKMKAVKKLIEDDRYNSLKDPRVSDSNIKNIVANYASKNGSDEIYDPYSYMDDK
jgi:hypothetical protein